MQQPLFNMWKMYLTNQDPENPGPKDSNDDFIITLTQHQFNWYKKHHKDEFVNLGAIIIRPDHVVMAKRI